MSRPKIHPDLPTITRLKALLKYDPETGLLTWAVNRRPRTHIGDEAGHVSKKDGAVLVGIDGHVYPASRVIWAMQKGRWPDYLLYFRDGNPANLSFSNLSTRRPRRSNTRTAAYARQIRELNYRARHIITHDPGLKSAFAYGTDAERRQVMREARAIVRRFDRDPEAAMHPAFSIPMKGRAYAAAASITTSGDEE